MWSTYCYIEITKIMAKEFLQSHGVDIDAEMSRVQDNVSRTSDPSVTQASDTSNSHISKFQNVSLPSTPSGSRWDVTIDDTGHIESITKYNGSRETTPTDSDRAYIDGKSALLAPSLCHPHVHLDKAFLLSHPRYSHLQIHKGDFQEAMALTAQAKAQFEEADLLERGQRLIDESVAAGVTHMRAFVEVDAGVGMKCLDAGVKLKGRAEKAGRCRVQLCAFAQLPLFTTSKGDEDGSVIRDIMEKAAVMSEVDVVGSTPYVESDRGRMERNVEWLVGLSVRHKKHVDFHLDYNLDPNIEPLVWHVIRALQGKDWNRSNQGRKIVLGHCTRLTLFSDSEWHRLEKEIGNLPISFVGLSTSDLFMMRTENRTRGTLDVPRLIKDFRLNACVGINNIGNAFTPHGSCDP